MYDVWNLVVATIVAVTVVVGGLALLLGAADRSERKQIASLAARLKCPKCEASPLVWTGTSWLVEVHCDYDESGFHDSEEGDIGGHEFRCDECKEAWKFTDEGDLYAEGGETP